MQTIAFPFKGVSREWSTVYSAPRENTPPVIEFARKGGTMPNPLPVYPLRRQLLDPLHRAWPVLAMFSLLYLICFMRKH